MTPRIEILKENKLGGTIKAKLNVGAGGSLVYLLLFRALTLIVYLKNTRWYLSIN